MVIRIISALLIANVYFLPVESQQRPLVWGDRGGRGACDMRYTSDTNKLACAEWPRPEIREDSEYMRVFIIKTPLSQGKCTLGQDEYRCPNLKLYWNDLASATSNPTINIWSPMYEKLVAERSVYGNFYMVSYDGEKVFRGQFGPFFVRSKWQDQSQTWAESDKIPGFLRKEGAESLYYSFRYFIPYLRNSPDTPDNDRVVIYWQSKEPAKRDFEVGANLQVTCRYDAEFNCEPPLLQNQQLPLRFMHSFVPQRNNHPLYPIIKTAYLELSHFYFELTQWDVDWKDKQDFYAYRATGSSQWQTVPATVQFVLYDSNPAPHGHCDDENSRWNQKNGEVRAIFAQFSVQLYGWNRPPTGSGTLYRGMMGTIYNITLNPGNWNEDQLRFLSKWQQTQLNTNKLPTELDNAFIDDRDIIWYKDWTKTTGMSVAFTLCSGDNAATPGVLTTRENGCMEYIHYKVDIRSRDWLK